MKSPLKGSNGGYILVQNLWVAQKCAFIGKSAIFTFFWFIFFSNLNQKLLMKAQNVLPIVLLNCT